MRFSTSIATIVVALAGIVMALAWRSGSDAAGAPQAAERPPPAAPAWLPVDGLRTEHPSPAFLPRLPQIGLVAPDSPFAGRDERDLVEHVYSRFSRYTETADGDRVEIALGDFRTIYHPELDSVPLYPDLATLDTDWRLATTPHVFQGPDGAAPVRYRAEWQPAENLAERADTAALLGLSVAEVTRLARRLAGDRSRTLAVTSYRVSAGFDGRSETYRAAFRWFLDADGELHLSIVDAVLHGLALALAETAPPAGTGRPAEIDRPPHEPDRGAAACVAQRRTLPATERTNGDDRGHLFGEHRSTFATQAECSCDGGCASLCESRVVTVRCEDVGRLDEAAVVHRTQGRAATQAVRAPHGDREPAKCLAALDCYTERCFAAECGSFTVTSHDAAPGVRFALSIDLVGSDRVSQRYSCGACAAR